MRSSFDYSNDFLINFFPFQILFPFILLSNMSVLLYYSFPHFPLSFFMSKAKNAYINAFKSKDHIFYWKETEFGIILVLDLVSACMSLETSPLSDGSILTNYNLRYYGIDPSKLLWHACSRNNILLGTIFPCIVFSFCSKTHNRIVLISVI